MKVYHYLSLGLLLVLFFVSNYFLYTISFELPKEEIKTIRIIPKKYPSVLNFGDVMFDRGVRNIMENRGRDPFEYIKKDIGLIKNFDVVIANLEGPIVEMDRKKCQSKAYNFQFSSTTPERLKSIGINMVNIANNHTWDCFLDGHENTKKYLEKTGVDYIGDNEMEKSYVIKIIDNKKIAFVGIDETVSSVLTNKTYDLIEKLNSENDYVIVNIHWGEEYKLVANNTQIDMAHKLIDNGVDVVFGHHPHVVEPVEVYKNKVIFYSLGNFVFDQNFGDTTVGLGAGVEFRDGKNIYTIFPFNIKLFAPEFMKNEERNRFCENYILGLNHTGCSFEI